ncbi:CoA-binding protein [Sorangium sp. So ce1335]|uniref:CoA-binding protein n=1 Tax=Sorangium sp. So ce1335 TaxID=3133335 RepID=UPI003F604CC5
MNDIRDISHDEARVAELVRSARRVAVLGIKTEAQSDQPAFYVPSYLKSAGVEVIPVPVYYPDVTTILGQQVYRRVADVPGPIDIVDVFRRSQDVTAHLDDLLAARPRAVWLQSGIRNDPVAEKLVEAGILVVQDRCLMVDHRRHAGRG